MITINTGVRVPIGTPISVGINLPDNVFARFGGPETVFADMMTDSSVTFSCDFPSSKKCRSLVTQLIQRYSIAAKIVENMYFIVHSQEMEKTIAGFAEHRKYSDADAWSAMPAHDGPAHAEKEKDQEGVSFTSDVSRFGVFKGIDYGYDDGPDDGEINDEIDDGETNKETTL